MPRAFALVFSHYPIVSCFFFSFSAAYVLPETYLVLGFFSFLFSRGRRASEKSFSFFLIARGHLIPHAVRYIAHFVQT